jgi:hypothetical protein
VLTDTVVEVIEVSATARSECARDTTMSSWVWVCTISELGSAASCIRSTTDISAVGEPPSVTSLFHGLVTPSFKESLFVIPLLIHDHCGKVFAPRLPVPKVLTGTSAMAEFQVVL